MFSRSARLVKLATNDLKHEKKRKNKSVESNISTFRDEEEETGGRESPLPSGFQNQYIKLNELLGDVFNEDNTTETNEPPPSTIEHIEPTALAIEYIEPTASSIENVEPTALTIENIMSTPLTIENITPTPLTTENVEPTASTSTHFEIDVGHERTLGTPMPSPCCNNICDNAFCVGYPENDSPPILTNDDLYGNLPTPSVTSVLSSSICTPTNKKKQTRQSTFKRDKGKKRLIHKENWIINKRKSLKNHGKGFINHRGKEIQEKQIREPCKCRLKCFTKFTESQRENIFKNFWNLGDRQKQWHFVVTYTKKLPKRRQTTEVTKHDRKNSFYYFLPNEDKQNTKVCKTMFLNTISVGERIVTTAWKKYDGEVSILEDKRGKYIHKPSVIDEEMIRSVCDHVKSFSIVESHYVRKDSKKLYLEDVRSSSRMFDLYCEWFDSEKYSNKATTKRQYRDILNKNFNIGFHKPKKDRCDICHIYSNKKIPTEEEKSAFLKHQSAKKVARALRIQDKNEAKSNKEIVAATFDFEKVLVTPHGDVSIFYYKRKLSTLNFTLYELATKDATCFMWHEAIAKRGANEVSSCLYQFIKQKVLQDQVKTFRFWSDNCAGQNRNRIVFALYLLAAKEFGVTITHRFMEKGHTQNEGDSVHSTVERASDRRLIYVPEEWYCLVRWAKSEGNPYKVVEVKTSDIMDFKSLLAKKNWSKNTENQKIQWTRIREVTVHAQQYDRIEYKYNFEDEPKTIIVLRSGKRNTERLSLEFQIKQAYNGDLSISRNKHKDLMYLCQTNIIPEKYHNFYQKLKYDQNVQEPLEDTDEDDDD